MSKLALSVDGQAVRWFVPGGHKCKSAVLRGRGLSRLDMHLGLPELSVRRRCRLLHDPAVPQRHLSGRGNIGDIDTYAVTRNDNAHAYPHCVANTDRDRKYTYGKHADADTVGCCDGDAGANDHRLSRPD